MLARFIELEDCIRTTVALLDREMPAITTEEWELIKQLVTILKPLEDATRLVSSQTYMTASLVLVVSDGLASTYENMLASKLDGSLVANILKGIVSDLKNRLDCKKLEESDPICLATFLDPRFKTFVFF